MEKQYELNEAVDSLYQTIDINNRYGANVNLFSEEYDVYDYEENETIGTYWYLEKDELLRYNIIIDFNLI